MSDTMRIFCNGCCQRMKEFNPIGPLKTEQDGDTIDLSQLYECPDCDYKVIYWEYFKMTDWDIDESPND